MIFLGVVTGYLLYQTVQASLIYYYSVDEFIAKSGQEEMTNKLIRLAGLVKEGSVSTMQFENT